MLSNRTAGPPALAMIAASLVGCGSGDAPQPDAEAPAAAVEEHPEWGYEDPVGPAAWGSLAAAYETCGTGRAQSPIDIGDAASQGDPVTLQTAYQPSTLRIIHHEHMADVVNTGHSIQVNYPGADDLMVGDDTYHLLQFHFHSPSEHHVRGEPFAMEMHLVHQSDDERLAVVSALIREGAENDAYAPIWANLPSARGEEVHYESILIDMNDLLPTNHSAYRYMGSLTTPPCSEQVSWFVLTTPVELSADQIATFREVMYGNNRPVQPLNGRSVTVDEVGSD